MSDINSCVSKIVNYVKAHILEAQFIVDPMSFRLEIPIDIDPIILDRFENPDECDFEQFEEIKGEVISCLEPETVWLAEQLRSTMQRTKFEVDYLLLEEECTDFEAGDMIVNVDGEEKTISSDAFIDMEDDSSLNFEVRLKQTGSALEDEILI